FGRKVVADKIIEVGGHPAECHGGVLPIQRRATQPEAKHTPAGFVRASKEHTSEIVLRCLRAATDGPFFSDCQFHASLELHHSEVNGLAAHRPPAKDLDGNTRPAINNSSGNLHINEFLALML
ncbi:MAG TPA: hypothetical protein VH120_20585, partial [Gemmataceae bacterium]|nr:hypothetical protein [Gemmataceae bacterium]